MMVKFKYNGRKLTLPSEAKLVKDFVTLLYGIVILSVKNVKVKLWRFCFYNSA